MRILTLLTLGLAATSCAVGTASLDGLASDSPDVVDAAVAVDSAGGGSDPGPTVPDAAAPIPDAATVRDTGGQPDTATIPDTATAPDTALGGCSAAGYTGALVTFDLSSEPGDEATAPATKAAQGVSAGGLARGGSLSPTSGSGSINASNWPSSADATRYYTFTLTPAAGCTVSLASLGVDVKASSSGPSNGYAATSADGFVAHTKTFNASGTSTLAFTNAAGSSAIEVRVYAYGASAAGGTFRLQNTLTLNGSIH